MRLSHLKRTIQAIGLVVLFFNCSVYAQETKKVLFVGNSYTYFWNLPQTVAAMASTQGIDLYVRQSSAGGANLKHHWHGEKNLKSRQIIAEGNWDYVIIQNHSKGTIEQIEDFHEYGNKFINQCKEIGAIPLLYQTWARKHNPRMQPSITAGYEQLAKSNEISVVRVGEIWMQVRGERPELELYDPDQSHPSPIGSYLNALIFYKVITGNSVLDIPHRITTTEKGKDKLYLNIQDENNAAYLKQLVNEIDF